MTGSGSSSGASDIGLSKLSTGRDTGFCITCSTNSSMEEYWRQWIFQGMGTSGSTGGSRTRGSGCYVLGLTQGAFFIFHLLTKPFPSRDQLPIHLNHMANHLTSHLTTHMTSHMPSSHLPLQCHLPYVTYFQITCTSPDTPLPNST